MTLQEITTPLSVLATELYGMGLSKHAETIQKAIQGITCLNAENEKKQILFESNQQRGLNSNSITNQTELLRYLGKTYMPGFVSLVFPEFQKEYLSPSFYGMPDLMPALESAIKKITPQEKEIFNSLVMHPGGEKMPRSYVYKFYCDSVLSPVSPKAFWLIAKKIIPKIEGKRSGSQRSVIFHFPTITLNPRIP